MIKEKSAIILTASQEGKKQSLHDKKETEMDLTKENTTRLGKSSGSAA